MYKYVIKSIKNQSTLTVKAKCHHQHCHDSTTLVDVLEPCHDEIREYWQKNKDSGHYNDGFYVVLPSGVILDIDGWEMAPAKNIN